MPKLYQKPDKMFIRKDCVIWGVYKRRIYEPEIRCETRTSDLRKIVPASEKCKNSSDVHSLHSQIF